MVCEACSESLSRIKSHGCWLSTIPSKQLRGRRLLNLKCSFIVCWAAKRPFRPSLLVELLDHRRSHWWSTAKAMGAREFPLLCCPGSATAYVISRSPFLTPLSMFRHVCRKEEQVRKDFVKRIVAMRTTIIRHDAHSSGFPQGDTQTTYLNTRNKKAELKGL